MHINIKRLYEETKKSDGYRILVDRLWPRGIKKEKANWDAWLKDIAPSDALRKWFNHDPKKWVEFQERYTNELKKNNECVSLILDKAKSTTITLLYGAKDTEHNHAIVLQHYLLTRKK